MLRFILYIHFLVKEFDLKKIIYEPYFWKYCTQVLVLGFFTILGGFLFSPCPVQADPASTVWLEKKKSSRSMSMGSMGSGAKKDENKDVKKTESPMSGQPKEKSPHTAMNKVDDAKDVKNEKKAEKPRRRRPMSRPAAYMLKTGDFLASQCDAATLAQTICWLKSPDQSYKRIIPQKTDDGFLIYDDAFLEGLYQIFLYQNAGVKDGVRYHHYSTLWFRNAGEKDFAMQTVSQEPREGMYGEEPIFYLKELTKDNENNFVRQKRFTGDIVPVQVLFRGKPIAGLPVTLLTQQGWQKTIVTDKKGIASFVLIKEVFHGDVINKMSEEYFFKVEYEQAVKGEFEGVVYEKEKHVANLRLSVFPTPSDWESKELGFYLIVGSLLVVIFAAAIRRKRMRTI